MAKTVSKLFNTVELKSTKCALYINYNSFYSYSSNKIEMILYRNKITKIMNQYKNKINIKIKFEGKGYYLYKNFRNTLAPKFGFAHRLYIYNYLVWTKMLSKTKLLIFGFNFEDCRRCSNNLRLLRPRNPFTGRGVRFGRSIRVKKKGKVSSFK